MMNLATTLSTVKYYTSEKNHFLFHTDWSLSVTKSIVSSPGSIGESKKPRIPPVVFKIFGSLDAIERR